MKRLGNFFSILIIFWSFPSWASVMSVDHGLERSLAAEVAEVEEEEIVEGEPTVEVETIWSPPNYTGQEKALGYASYGFKVPAGLEERVQFWMDIYTKYSSQQGVLHDSRYVHLVYGSLDFTDIWARTDITSRERDRLIDKRQKDEKKKIEDRLKHFQSVDSTFGFNEEDLKLWEMFKSVDEPNKFIEASKKGRLRFQLGQSDIFKNGIRQSGYYIRQMEEIFRQEGMPIELTRMVFVESSFNLRARSRVGASGIWQFMKSTAKRYMRMDASVDERNDPLTATRAAARKLRQNYEMLEDWPLAVTGYNHGPYGILRLSKKLNSKNIIDFVDFRKGSFGFASASFYASFMAALEVEKRASEFYGLLKIEKPLIGTELKLKRHLPISKLIEFFNGDVEKAKTFNPHVLSHVWKRKGSILRRNMVRLDAEALAKAQSWAQYKVYF